MSANNATLLTHLFHARANFHLFAFVVLVNLACDGEMISDLFVSISDSALIEIICCELNLDFISRKNSNVVHSHFSRNLRDDFVAIFEFNSKHCVA